MSFMRKADRDKNYPTLVTWTDPSGKCHVPPLPPLVEGAPPWVQRPHEYRREQPLPKCPSLACRRAAACNDPHHGKFCRKTHMDVETYRIGLIKRITALNKRFFAEGMHLLPRSNMTLRQAFLLRSEEGHREELLKWQSRWIEQKKAEYETRQVKNRKGKVAVASARPSHHMEATQRTT